VTALRQRPTARYRFYDSIGQPLYCGIAVNLKRRWAVHRAVSPWWHTIDQTRTQVDWYPDRDAAEAAEVRAIAAEGFIHNVQHTSRANRAAARPSRWLDARIAGAGAFSGHRILLTIQELRAQLKGVVDAVVQAGRHAVFTRHGKHLAVLVPIDWYREAAEKMGDPTEY
jgi:prevent-host-death family protein